MQWPAEGWEIQPDIVVNGPEFKVPARTRGNAIEWMYITVPSGITQDTWITSMEIRPSEPAVTHHICVHFMPHNSDVEYGKYYWNEVMRDDRGVEIPRKKGETMQQNLEAKLALCVRLDELVARSPKTNKKWQESFEKIEALMVEWKKTGYAPKQENEAVWQRFRAARKVFFDARDTFFDAQRKEQAHNLNLKNDLVKQAEALQKKLAETVVEATAGGGAVRGCRVLVLPRFEHREVVGLADPLQDLEAQVAVVLAALGAELAQHALHAQVRLLVAGLERRALVEDALEGNPLLEREDERPDGESRADAQAAAGSARRMVGSDRAGRFLLT